MNFAHWPLYFAIVVCAVLGGYAFRYPSHLHKWYESRYRAASPGFRRLLFLKSAIDNPSEHATWLRFVGVISLALACLLTFILMKIE